jgi:hypothetical protein
MFGIAWSKSNSQTRHGSVKAALASRAADMAKAITLRSSKQEKAEEHVQELLEPPGGAQLPPAGQPPLATPRKPTPAPQQMEEIADVMRKMLANEPGGRSS